MMQTNLVPLLGSQREHHEFALRAETAQVGHTIMPGQEFTSRHASIIYAGIILGIIGCKKN